MVTLSCEAIKTSDSASMKHDKFSWKGPELKPSQVKKKKEFSIKKNFLSMLRI